MVLLELAMSSVIWLRFDLVIGVYSPRLFGGGGWKIGEFFNGVGAKSP